ncbi:sulfotransferase [Ekhidna sp. MALMAid0563]|uniref:sulfotransferase family protein n=1 Tax=Ekhidna sp. MALMAid0563 TaxID=3143937 RepID=UPI0032DFC616
MSLIEKVVRKVLVNASSILKLFERPLINKYGRNPIHQPVFIIGAPRTGSTALYQSVTERFRVTYFDNLMDYLNRNPILGTLLSNFFFGESGHSSFESELGRTFKSGLHSPSECGAFWYRWLPRDRHYIVAEEVSEESKMKLKEEIIAISNLRKQPLVFKNLNAGQRLSLIYELFPNSKVIFIRREPLFTVQSIVKAKQKLNIPLDQFWSIKPKNFEKLEKLTWAKQIVGQVFYLEKQIEEDIKLFDNHLIVRYEDFINDSESITRKVGKFIFDEEIVERKCRATPKIRARNQIKLSNEMIEEIEKELSCYYAD